jgi:DNA-binding CsgD family transcriptional regulator
MPVLARAGEQMPGDDPAAVLGTLTRQERVIFDLLASGASNAEIAAALCVSVNTVKTHLRHLYRKIGQRRRVRVAFLARAALAAREHRTAG